MSKLKEKKIVVLIPARGGSKGIPNKNIIDFQGMPLIQHSIEYAKQSKYIDNIYVSTDNSEIKLISINCGATVIDRPKNISRDESSTESAIQHFVDTISLDLDSIIVLLQPTSPLRPSNSLDEILKEMVDKNLDSIFTISALHPLTWNIIDGKIKSNYNYKQRPRRQDFTDNQILYDENGSVYIFSLSMFKENKNRIGGKIGYFVFNEEYGKQIDTYFDLHIIDSIAQYLNRDKKSE